MKKEIITVRATPVNKPPEPIPKRRNQSRRLRREMHWGWLATLGSLVLVLALIAQAVLVEEDLERLAAHHEKSYTYLYGIAVLILMLAWVIEEIYVERWSDAIKGVAAVCFYHCYNISIEGVYQSAKQHELPQWQIALFSSVVPEKTAVSCSLLVSVVLLIALMIAFDRFGKAGVAMVFHAHEVRVRERKKVKGAR